MPLKLNVGLSRKVGEANYGSRGASVNVELEVDSALVTEPAKLQERIRQLFGVVRSSLAEELNGPNSHPKPNDNSKPEHQTRLPINQNAQTRTQRSSGGRTATQSQVKAINAIARRYQVSLATILQERFHVTRPDDLSIQEASLVIDELKSSESSNPS